MNVPIVNIQCDQKSEKNMNTINLVDIEKSKTEEWIGKEWQGKKDFPNN